jgi:tRNA(Ile)-lysidine synthase
MPAGVTAEGFAAVMAPFADSAAVGLAVSGGADSLALLLLAERWARALESPPALYVYSVDHGLRPEAAGEVGMVMREAEARGMVGRPLLWSGDKPATGVQEAARQARYRLIGEAMAQDGADVLVTAHHRRDQAETVLMRLAHGSGLDGLSGMAALSLVEGVTVFRPLLSVDPEALLAMVEAEGLTPADDPSNRDPHYERVRWRSLLPRLAALGLDNAVLARFAERAGEAEAALAATARQRFIDLAMLDGFGAAEIDARDFAEMPKAIAVRVLARVLAVVGGQQNPRALGIVERLREALVSGDVSKARTILGCVVRNAAGKVTVAREPGRQSLPALTLAPGQSIVWDQRFVIANRSEADNLAVRPAEYWQRRHLEELFGTRIGAPMEAIRTAPMVLDGAEAVLALGSHIFDPRVSVEFRGGWEQPLP